jgi:hypothetical protein
MGRVARAFRLENPAGALAAGPAAMGAMNAAMAEMVAMVNCMFSVVVGSCRS